MTATAASRAADVLILGSTVTSGTASTEYQIITSTGAVPAFPTVTGLGKTADIVPSGPFTWTSPPQPYSKYQAIVLGDPNCASSPAPLAAAEANSAGPGGWAAAVTGNVVIIGTDPTVHPGPAGAGGAQLWRSAIGFATAGPGTGAVISLSCYYQSVASGTPVPVLKGFESTGTFSVQGNIPCAGNVAIVAASPALTGLTGGPGGTLSAWSCSVHEGFNSWDPSFIPLAIATDVAPALKTYPVADPKGFPYILARGKDLTPVDEGGILKVCKVAGLGITIGSSYTFTAGSSTFTVPAGPAPGGYCVVGPSFSVGTNVTISETIPAGNAVSSIVVAPPSQLVGSPNLAGGSVNVAIGSGVTEVTFTDKRTGFVEICKTGKVTGNFSFTVNPGGLGPITVPAGACSPAIEVAAGPVVIQELPTPGAILVGCTTTPAANQVACNTGAHTSTVNVVPGNVSTMTIAYMLNRPTGPGGVGTDHGHTLGATTTTLSCAPAPVPAPGQGPAPLRGAANCVAKVAASEPRGGSPTGAVAFAEGDTTLATVQLSPEGSATFAPSALAAGTHAIVASYQGDATFSPSTSQQALITAGPP